MATSTGVSAEDPPAGAAALRAELTTWLAANLTAEVLAAGRRPVDVANLEAALQVARDLGKANPGGAYELRPINLYQPGIEIK